MSENKAKQAVNLSNQQIEEILAILEKRFLKHMHRHEGIKWKDVQSRLEKNPEKLYSLYEMEITGGEPDIINYDKADDKYVFYDFSAESPSGRRNLCYDREALEARKKFPPSNSALEMAAKMGIEILSEAEYRELQKHGNFDTKTSSWVKTPEKIRKLGGALFCDRRYDTVFVFHNGADSYYSSRGFRGSLKV